MIFIDFRLCSLAPVIIILGWSNQIYSLEEYSTSNNWFRSHGNNFSTRFSNFNKINNENAKNLKLAWIYSPIDEKNFIYNVQANPIFYKGNIFLPNSQNQIVSINGLTGEQNWKFNVDKGIAAKRGMILYKSEKDNKEPRIFFVNNRNRLFSLNANTLICERGAFFSAISLFNIAINPQSLNN